MVGKRVSRPDEQPDSLRVMENDLLAAVRRHWATGGQVWLFLDYDGTLVPIGRTPDESRPDAALLELLTSLAESPAVRVVILSGRPLSFLRAILPIPGLTLAGTYGIEIQMPGQGIIIRAEPDRLRPAIEQVKSGLDQVGRSTLRVYGGRQGTIHCTSRTFCRSIRCGSCAAPSAVGCSARHRVRSFFHFERR